MAMLQVCAKGCSFLFLPLVLCNWFCCVWLLCLVFCFPPLVLSLSRARLSGLWMACRGVGLWLFEFFSPKWPWGLQRWRWPFASWRSLPARCFRPSLSAANLQDYLAKAGKTRPRKFGELYRAQLLLSSALLSFPGLRGLVFLSLCQIILQICSREALSSEAFCDTSFRPFLLGRVFVESRRTRRRTRARIRKKTD